MNSALSPAREASVSLMAPALAPRASSGFTRLIRAIFSFPVFLAFSLIGLTAFTIRDRFDDPDLWWHLKTGQVIWATHAVPTTEIFSYTAAGHAWIPHEWLSELSLYGAYRLAGYTGLMLWFVTFASLLVVLVYALSCLYSGNAKVSLAGGLMAWFFGSIGMMVRPLVLGHLLLVVELLLLELGRKKNPKWFWGLPLVFAIWVNCHASYPFGLLVLGITVVCAFFQWRRGPVASRTWTSASRTSLVTASIASVAALLCNPMGWRLLIYPLNTLFLQHAGISDLEEWLPLPFLDPRAVALLVIVGGIGLAAAARTVEIHLEEAILISVASVMAVQHKRMLFLFGIIAGPVVCRLLAGFWENYDSRRDRPLANGVCIGIAIAAIALSFPAASELKAEVTKTSPVGAVAYVRKAHLAGPMLNEYKFGGYLVWGLPEYKVFIDGRSVDVFDWAEYRRWAYLEEDPQILLDKYHIQFCLLDSGNPLTRVLPYLPGWRKVYSDTLASVFVRGEAPRPQPVKPE